MSPQDAAAQALAELESKIDAGLKAVRSRSAEAKSKLEHGVLNLQNRAELSPVAVEASDAAAMESADLNWDLETEAAAEAVSFGEAAPLDDFASLAPEPPASFKDELDVAVDEEGIPLGE